MAAGFRLRKTGNRRSFYSGDDSAKDQGIALAGFTDNANGTVTHELTGFIWLKHANFFGLQTWASAIDLANALAHGTAGLTDGSIAGVWRMPNVIELQSLLDYGAGGDNGVAMVTEGHPFDEVQSGGYWTSSTGLLNFATAWLVDFGGGAIVGCSKDDERFFWPVRDA